VEKYKQFAKTGPAIKKQIDDLVDNEKYQEAIDIAREKLKEAQNFMKELTNKSNYYSQLETIVEDISNLINMINKKAELKKETQNTNQVDNKKFYKTKILSEEVRENATKIAETDINFSDFPVSAFGFEKAFNSLKNRNEVFFNYLMHLGGKTMESIYKSTEIAYSILSGIIGCLKQCGLG
jgi:DNA repair exonuclease SbcCD ATPase subunit